MHIYPKKSLGQHFLKDANIIRKIITAFHPPENSMCMEIGAGTGALTESLLKKYKKNIIFTEIDKDAFGYLCKTYTRYKDMFVNTDFLTMRLTNYKSLALIGNLPYNISTQIIFKILDNREVVNYGVFMVQKEVAERFAAQPNNKNYGILSVLLQVFYNVEILFRVSKNVFIPPPKVESAVFRITKKTDVNLSVPDKYFFFIVKKAFGMRRKMLRKSLHDIIDFSNVPEDIYLYAQKRPEQLSKYDFLKIADFYFKYKSDN